MSLARVKCAGRRRGNGRCRYGFPSFEPPPPTHSTVPDLAQLRVDLSPHIALLSFERVLCLVDTFLLFLLRLYRKKGGQWVKQARAQPKAPVPFVSPGVVHWLLLVNVIETSTRLAICGCDSSAPIIILAKRFREETTSGYVLASSPHRRSGHAPACGS